MPLVLCRVDDRLIHGQVVVGWGQPLGVDFIALVDDEVAASSWEQELYRMAVPAEIAVVFTSVSEARRRLAEWQRGTARGILLTGDIDSMAALFRADGAAVRNINLGGVHHTAGRTERLPYLYLSDEELDRLEALERDGARITAQDVPTAPAVPLRALE